MCVSSRNARLKRASRAVLGVADVLVDESVRLLEVELAKQLPPPQVTGVVEAVKRDVLSLWAINLLDFALVEGQLTADEINEWLDQRLDTTRFLLDA